MSPVRARRQVRDFPANVEAEMGVVIRRRGAAYSRQLGPGYPLLYSPVGNVTGARFMIRRHARGMMPGAFHMTWTGLAGFLPEG